MKYFYLFLVAVFWSGCGGGFGVEDDSYYGDSSIVPLSSSSSSSSNYSISSNRIKSSSNTNPDISLDSNDRYKKLTIFSSKVVNVKVSSPSDIYVLLTNTKNSTRDLKGSASQKSLKVASAGGSYSDVLRFRRELKSYFDKNSTTILKNFKRLEKEVGDRRRFYIDIDGYRFTDTVLKVKRRVHTKFGDKTLSIYVSNDVFDDGNCYKRYCVTQDMVDTLADKFLRTGEDNDIYDWETNIFGEEWSDEASKKNSSLIKDKNEIVILLTDIDGDNNAQSGAIGYFWAKDAFNNIRGSNQEIMFYIDAVMFANRGNRSYWSSEEKMPMETISTLAHEFQHMISFYQKSVLLTDGNPSDTWLDETMSCSVEYLLSSKIHTTTPRQISWEDGSAGSYPISDGQLPDFNRNINSYSLSSWHNSPAEYGGAYAFGAYLLQNYGGAELLKNIMHNRYTDEKALLSGIKTTTKSDIDLNTLLRNCGVGVMLSDKILDPISDKPFVYNSGDYNCKTYNKTVYCMGSINFFNYNPKPNFTLSSSGDILPNSNKYLKIAEYTTGNFSIGISLGEGVIATVIVKER